MVVHGAQASTTSPIHLAQREIHVRVCPEHRQRTEKEWHDGKGEGIGRDEEKPSIRTGSPAPQCRFLPHANKALDRRRAEVESPSLCFLVRIANPLRFAPGDCPMGDGTALSADGEDADKCVRRATECVEDRERDGMDEMEGKAVGFQISLVAKMLKQGPSMPIRLPLRCIDRVDPFSSHLVRVQ